MLLNKGNCEGRPCTSFGFSNTSRGNFPWFSRCFKIAETSNSAGATGRVMRITSPGDSFSILLRKLASESSAACALATSRSLDVTVVLLMKKPFYQNSILRLVQTTHREDAHSSLPLAAKPRDSIRPAANLPLGCELHPNSPPRRRRWSGQSHNPKLVSFAFP